jgi:hypothetical protein
MLSFVAGTHLVVPAGGKRNLDYLSALLAIRGFCIISTNDFTQLIVPIVGSRAGGAA